MHRPPFGLVSGLVYYFSSSPASPRPHADPNCAWPTWALSPWRTHALLLLLLALPAACTRCDTETLQNAASPLIHLYALLPAERCARTWT